MTPPASVGAAYFISSSEPVPPANAVAAEPAARAATPAPARKERRERVIFQILSSHRLAGDHLRRCARAHACQYTSPSRALQLAPGRSPRFLRAITDCSREVENPGCYQPEQRQPEGFPKLRIRSRAFCGEDQQRGKSLRRASRTNLSAAYSCARSLPSR